MLAARAVFVGEHVDRGLSGRARWGLVPEDAKEAFGHGIRAKRSKSGAVSFEVIDGEASDAPLE